MFSRPLLFATIVLSAIIIQADDTSLPLCAQDCAVTAAVEAGCSTTDTTCLCTNQDFLNDVETCVQIDCDSSEQEEATQYFDASCSGVSSATSLTSGSTASTSSSTTEAAGTTSTSAAAAASSSSSSSSSAPGFKNSAVGRMGKDVLKFVVGVVVVNMFQ